MPDFEWDDNKNESNEKSMSNQISVKEALRLISKGQFSSQMEVTFEGVDGIEALDAVALGEAGVDVPEHLIFYDDSAIVDDEAFDGPWEKIDSDIEEEAKYLQIEMKLDPEIRNWINSNRIDVNLLVKKLVEDAYRTAKLVQK